MFLPRPRSSMCLLGSAKWSSLHQALTVKGHKNKAVPADSPATGKCILWIMGLDYHVVEDYQGVTNRPIQHRSRGPDLHMNVHGT